MQWVSWLFTINPCSSCFTPHPFCFKYHQFHKTCPWLRKLCQKPFPTYTTYVYDILKRKVSDEIKDTILTSPLPPDFNIIWHLLRSLPLHWSADKWSPLIQSKRPLVKTLPHLLLRDCGRAWTRVWCSCFNWWNNSLKHIGLAVHGTEESPDWQSVQSDWWLSPREVDWFTLEVIHEVSMGEFLICSTLFNAEQNSGSHKFRRHSGWDASNWKRFQLPWPMEKCRTQIP